MAQRREFTLPVRDGSAVVVHTAFTDASDGDLSREVEPSTLRRRRHEVVDLPWVTVHQVHGDTIVEAEGPDDLSSVDADGVITERPDLVAAVQVADCAPVLMWSAGEHGAVVAAVHAGWRGLEAGILGRAVEELRARTGTNPRWLLGPCISADSYEFGAAELDRLVERFGPAVRATTSWGTPALDMRAAVAAAMATAGCAEPRGEPPCTFGSPSHFSHRSEGDRRRQAGLVWWHPLDPAPDPADARPGGGHDRR